MKRILLGYNKRSYQARGHRDRGGESRRADDMNNVFEIVDLTAWFEVFKYLSLIFFLYEFYDNISMKGF